MKKITIIIGLMILLCGSLKAQDTPDPSIEVKSWQAIPGMEYPSTVIFGFVKACQESFLRSGAFSDQLWPNHLYEMCGCMIDYMREDVPYKTFLDRYKDPKFMNESDRQWIAQHIMICVTSVKKGWATNNE